MRALLALIALACATCVSARDRGEIRDGDFQDQVRQPVDRSVPDKGSGKIPNDPASGGVFQPSVDERLANKKRGRGREPFTFKDNDEILAMMDSEYERAVADVRASFEDYPSGQLWGMFIDRLIYRILNPENITLLPEESQALKESVDQYMRKFGFTNSKKEVARRMLRQRKSIEFIAHAARSLQARSKTAMEKHAQMLEKNVEAERKKALEEYAAALAKAEEEEAVRAAAAAAEEEAARAEAEAKRAKPERHPDEIQFIHVPATPQRAVGS